VTVFINYRREDSEGTVRALYNRLTARFGKKHCFLDLNTIAAGEDWRKRIGDTLKNVDAIVVVIGPRWSQILGDRAGQPEEDLVCLEIAEALRRPAVLVVPVLVEGAVLPRRESLPEDIRGLEAKNVLEIRGNAWEDDVARLIRALQNARALPQSPRVLITRSVFVVLAGVAGLLGLDWLLGLNWLLVKVPRLPPGLEYVRAEQRLQTAGLTAEKVLAPGDDDGKSVPRVLDQQPEAGSTAFRGSAVKLALIRQHVYPLVCRGGGVLGDGHGQSSSTDGSDRLLRFERNLVAKATLDLKSGECSFTDRPMWSTEPDAMLASDEDGELTDALRSPSEVVFVCVINEYQKRFIAVQHEDYPFSDGQWIPKAGLEICPNT
jgi:hypothetical protein